MKYKFKIEGLDCPNCAIRLEKIIKKIDGVDDASISFITQKLIIECNEENSSEVIQRVKEIIKEDDPKVIITEK